MGFGKLLGWLELEPRMEVLRGWLQLASDGSVVFSPALLAPRGGLAITSNMILVETIEALATVLQDLLTGGNISRRRAACR